MPRLHTDRDERRRVYLRARETSVVLDATSTGMPMILHWGSDLGDLDVEELAALASTSVPILAPSTIDHPVMATLLPEPSTGWPWTPGIEGHRSGTDFSTAFHLTEWDTVVGTGVAGGSARACLVDDSIGLELVIDVELTEEGLLRTRAGLTNCGASGDYTLDALALFLPVPGRADEILDFSGRHLRERAPQRHPLAVGVHRREGRRGRTGLDSTMLMCVGVTGFGFGHGEVWAVHTAWSGNHLSLTERTSLGHVMLGGGELLMPGEVVLAPGERYTSPWVVGSYSSHGLDDLSSRFHDFLRSRVGRPTTPRPVVMNTWEAVYFDHDLATLTRLADLGASVGVERFVLDDGWFRQRRSDSAGLGDWFVDETVWPDGLSPLVDHVRSLGMQFGIWVEPEMINMDSDVAREHPQWVMGTGYRLPPEGRHQQVIDLANPEAYQFVLERLDALLTENPIDYLKWDHNRDLVEAGHPLTRRAGVHDQTAAAYRLMDALKAGHPGLEIESCSSGGGRVDLEVLMHTDRIWTSDCIDPLERQSIQRWTSLLVPLEMLGAHVAAPRSHTTGRRHDLDFRAVTALFGHFGIEWDLTSATADELRQLAEWVCVYKRFRFLLHQGTLHRADHPDPAYWMHTVVSKDGTEALVAFVAMATGSASPPGRVCVPGLRPNLRYRITPVDPRDQGSALGAPSWWAQAPVVSGAVLGAVGIQGPALFPEHASVVHLVAV